MKIRMIKLQAGPGGVRAPGSVHDVPAEEGAALVQGGYAVPVTPAAETAATAGPENAATRTEAPPFRPVGGGMYELADGSRVRGKAAAIKASGGQG